YIAKQNHKNIAILHSVNTYYESIYESCVEQLEAQGAKLGSKYAIDPKFSDFRSLILKLKNENVDAVIALLQESGEMNSFLKQSRELDLDVQIYAADITFDEVILKKPELANDVILFRYISTANQEFAKRYSERFKVPSNLGIGEAYDNVFIIKEAIEKCGDKTEQIRECLHKINYKGVSGIVTFDKNGIINSDRKVTELQTVKDGKFVPLNL
ncbi:MAG: ABC transporter substrate-binding protein, partial [Deltaproteobacteria bacterium]|nr:ABC transporter substrate-binding protein [Deltaproteobacteria bacterium]